MHSAVTKLSFQSVRYLPALHGRERLARVATLNVPRFAPYTADYFIVSFDSSTGLSSPPDWVAIPCTSDVLSSGRVSGVPQRCDPPNPGPGVSLLLCCEWGRMAPKIGLPEVSCPNAAPTRNRQRTR